METMTLNNSSKGKTALSVIGVIIAAVLFFAMIAIIACWVYVRKHPECLPTTASVSYVNDVVDENGNKMSFIEVEYWKNKNNTGTEVFEFTLNGYTDWQNKTILKKGVQFVAKNDGSGEYSKYYYDKQGDISWASVNKLNRETKLFVNIDSDMYAVSLSGEEVYYEDTVTFNSFMKGLGSLITPSRWSKGVTFKESVKKTTYKDLDGMFVTMSQKLSTSNVKNGEYKMSLVDLSNYFKLWRYDADNQKFNDCDVQTWNIEYFTTTVRVHDNGLKNAEESQFGEVAQQNDYVSESVETEFYGAVYSYPTLTVDDFTWEHYEVYQLDLKKYTQPRIIKNVYVPTIKDDVKKSLQDKGIKSVYVKFDTELLGIENSKTATVLQFNDFMGTIVANEYECSAVTVYLERG
ncbi:MAG: hypothetical protein SPG87_05825 [Eubacteriales bacterium]|nr:hypothetical protein [Eubacteriales bacterium]